MCAGSNDELYARARSAGEADYLLEESLRVSLESYADYQRQRADEAIAALRAKIVARRDDYTLKAFDRAFAKARMPDLEQARALVESAGAPREGG